MENRRGPLVKMGACIHGALTPTRMRFSTAARTACILRYSLQDWDAFHNPSQQSEITKNLSGRPQPEVQYWTRNVMEFEPGNKFVTKTLKKNDSQSNRTKGSKETLEQYAL